MEALLKLLTYASGAVFVIAMAYRLINYFTMPVHVRWELYPIPHEGKDYGGSFYEEVDHWTKGRHKDHVAQLMFMIPEILFIRALHEDNRPLWYWTFPFHMGLYMGIGGLVCLTFGALLQAIFGWSPPTSAIAVFFQSLTVIMGVIGFILGTIGALGLVVKRLTDPVLKDYYNAGIDYLNLLWLAGIFATGFLSWLADPSFNLSRQYLVSCFTFTSMPEPMKGIQVINLLLFLGFWAYFPFTHMTHMVSKYFMWDKVKWDDDPNRGNAALDAKIKSYLAYPVSWAAEHVGAEGGRRSWAEVATTNPWAAKEEK